MKYILFVLALFTVLTSSAKAEANTIGISQKKAVLYEGYPLTMAYDGINVTLTCIADKGCYIKGIEVNLGRDKNSTSFVLDRNAWKTNFPESDPEANTFFRLDLGTTSFTLYSCPGKKNSDGSIGEFDWSKCSVEEDIRGILFAQGDTASFKKADIFEVDINEGEAVFRID